MSAGYVPPVVHLSNNHLQPQQQQQISSVRSASNTFASQSAMQSSLVHVCCTGKRCRRALLGLMGGQDACKTSLFFSFAAATVYKHSPGLQMGSDRPRLSHCEG